MRRYLKKHLIPLATLSAVLGTICAGPVSLYADSTNSASDGLQKENDELKLRVQKLEDLMKQQGVMPSAATNDPPVAAMSAITLSGFVTASYFYDVAGTRDTHPTGYLWNTAMNQFTLNKAKLVLASPALDKDKWDAGFNLSLLYGQDQTIDDPSGGPYSAIREAYILLNIPIGTGIGVKVGQMTSLLNYESGDGGAVNDNFSQGYQWYYTGNPPSDTVQLSYDFNDMFSIKARVQNGLYNGEVNTGQKTFMGGFYVKPDSKTSLAFIGFGGKQVNIGQPPYFLSGASFIGSRQLMETYNLKFALEADYFHYSGFDTTAPALAGFDPTGTGFSAGDWWSVGGWLTADVAPKVRIALRGELINDPTGFGTVYNSPSPSTTEYGAAGFPASIYTTGEGQMLTEVTLTLDYTPVPTIKIQPEIRWNHTTVSTGFSGKSDQIIMGMGVSYIF